MGLAAEPTARTFGLEELLRLVMEGKIRIPHFQRGIRWGPKEAAELLDSVLRGFPIGSLLLWKRTAPAETVHIGDIVISVPQQQEAYYVVDGQQRITTLANSLSKEYGKTGRFAMELDIKTLQVRTRRPGGSATIELPTLFHLRDFLSWNQANPQWAEQIETLNDAASRLREFHIPAYVVESDDESTLKEIFDRMNSAGKRLSRAEVFSALFAPPEPQSAARASIGKIQEHVLGELRWGLVDDDTLLRVMLARRAPDVTREIRLEFSDARKQDTDFPTEDRDEAYAGAELALNSAISFLIDIGVPHFSLLPYRYLLIVLARFFALFRQPSNYSVEMLRRWFWRAAIVGPNVSKASTTGAVRRYASAVVRGDEEGSIRRLIESVDKIAWRPQVNNFRANQAESRIMLCALWDLQPRNLLTPVPITREELSDVIEQGSTASSVCLEAVRRTNLSLDFRNSVGNRLVLTDPTDDIVATLSTTLLDKATLDSHAIAETALEALRSGNYVEFVRQRTETISEIIEAFVTRQTGARFEDTPPLATLIFDDADEETLAPEDYRDDIF